MQNEPGIAMTTEAELKAKPRTSEALFTGPGSAGECRAAMAARDRILREKIFKDTADA